MSIKMNKKWLLISFFPALAGIFPLVASADTEEDGRLWLNFSAQGDTPVERWRWYAEIQPRWREEGEQFDQLIIRPAVNYKLTDASSIWLGYAHVTSHPVNRATVDENRLWQQYIYNFSPINGVAITSRTRLEQRWLENGEDTGYRLRQTLRLARPFDSAPSLSAVVSDEIFINLNSTDWGARSGFDQNRLFAGFSYAITGKTKVEMGYLNQYVRTSTNDRMNHVLSTSFSINFK